MHRRFYSLLAATVLSLALTVCTQPGYAQPTTQFHLPAQSLADSLRAVGSQTNINILFAPPLVAGRQAPALNAQLTTDEALARILAGSGLTHQFLNESTVIVATGRASGVRSEGTSAKGPAGNSQDMHGAGNPLHLVKADAVTASSAAQSSGQEPPSTEESKTGESEVVVTGSHIRGVKDVAAPAITITREQFEQTGASTVQEIFQSLPQNFDEMSSDVIFGRGGTALAGQNLDRASAVDLRGLGSGSTLTLLNGMRRAGSINGQVVDVTQIPLSVIERVDIVTGGRSAAYGSDAVAGVVNLVTRRDFQGIQSQAYFGGSDRGGQRLQLSTITGGKFGRGGIVAAYDYAHEWRLDLLNTPAVEVPRPDGVRPLHLDLRPDSTRNSVFLAGHYSLTERIELTADALYTDKKFLARTRDRYEGAENDSWTYTRYSGEHYNASLGANVDLGRNWSLALTAGTGVANNDTASGSLYDVGPPDPDFPATPSYDTFDVETDLTTASAVFDGPLFTIGSITPQVALGAETRKETLERHWIIDGVQIARFAVDRDRTVNSAFAEASVPFVANGGPGLRRLEFSVAGRYDDYADFGSTFNPQYGLIWSPAESLTLRAAYSTAFRAPALTELGSLARVLVTYYDDPRIVGTPIEDCPGCAPVLQWEGPSESLTPEKAGTWSLGFDYDFPALPNSRLSMSFFEVKYRDRIDVPAFSATDQELVLDRENLFGALINRHPSQALIETILGSDGDGRIPNFIDGSLVDPATLLAQYPTLIVFDNRSSNIAVEKLRGLDMKIDTRFDAAGSEWSLGLNGTYTLDHDRSVTAASPLFSLLDEPGKPVNFRMRANAGWSRGAFGSYVYVDYVDKYRDPVANPVQRVDSWTTVSFTVRLDSSKLAHRGLLGDFTAALSVDNAFDTEPPRVTATDYGLIYDPANHDVQGRFISLRLTKNW